MRTLFLPEAKMIATGRRADGTVAKRTMSVEDYINNSGPFLEKDGFFEREISRRPNHTEVLCMYSVLMNPREGRRMPTRSCEASTVFNYGTMANAGGSSIFFGRARARIRQYQENTWSRPSGERLSVHLPDRG